MIVRGVRLALHPPGDYVSDRIRSSGEFHEAAILDHVAAHLADVPSGVVVDAGAMLGNHAAFLAAFLPRLTIHAWEPVPANIDLLVANLEPFDNVVIHPVALSDEGRKVAMDVPANRGHASIIAEGGSLTVLALPLDAYLLERVRLLKIDVEGHEPEVLAGARETIARYHPAIVIEDWRRQYAALLPGYRLTAEWEQAHQTFMYEWAG